MGASCASAFSASGRSAANWVSTLTWPCSKRLMSSSELTRSRSLRVLRWPTSSALPVSPVWMSAGSDSPINSYPSIITTNRLNRRMVDDNAAGHVKHQPASARGIQNRRQPIASLGDAAEQPRILDGDGGVVCQELQQLHAVGGVFSDGAAVHVHDAEHLALANDRHADDRADACLQDARADLALQVRVVDEHRLARSNDTPGHPMRSND